jgi:hypothetical protein
MVGTARLFPELKVRRTIENDWATSFIDFPGVILLLSEFAGFLPSLFKIKMKIVKRIPSRIIGNIARQKKAGIFDSSFS